MATQTTPKRAIRYDDLPDTADAKRLGQNLATDLDNVANIYAGTLAARPTASVDPGHGAANPGSWWYTTDTLELFINMSGLWLKVSTEPGIPIGASIEYAGAGDPADTRFLLRDGRELARVGTYAALFAAIGTVHGSGNGSTTFNIPDDRGRVTVGPDNMGTARGAAGRISGLGLGSVGGERDHTLSTAEIPAHNHPKTDPGHPHTITRVKFLGPGPDGTPAHRHNEEPGYLSEAPRADPYVGAAAPVTTDSATTGITIGNTGGGGNHNNLQPYLGMNKIIRVK